MDEDFNVQMEKARQRVADLDLVDGLETYDDTTIAMALEAGLKCPATGAQYDALVMLKKNAGLR